MFLRMLLTAILGALACLGCSEEDPPRAVPKSAPIPAQFQACDSTPQCALVDITCTGCCDRDAISRADSARYVDSKAGVCVGDVGIACGCCELPARAVCVDGRCIYERLAETCVP